MNEREPSELAALQVVLGLCLLAAWVVWFLSLPMSLFLGFAFDSEVSVRDGLVLGAIHATWVAGIAAALTILTALVINGRDWAESTWVWLVLMLLAVVWVGILAFWIYASATD